MKDRIVTANMLALLGPAALLAGAYGFQYIGHIPPCEMCWWQRYAHMAAVALALMAMMLRGGVRRAFVLLAAAAIAVSGLIGIYHAGIEQKWWEGVTACTAPMISGSVQDVLAQVMATPLVRCDTIPWSLFGISMAGWNAILSLLCAGVVTWLTTRRR